jgi:hypothetical protein
VRVAQEPSATCGPPFRNASRSWELILSWLRSFSRSEGIISPVWILLNSAMRSVNARYTSRTSSLASTNSWWSRSFGTGAFQHEPFGPHGPAAGMPRAASAAVTPHSVGGGLDQPGHVVRVRCEPISAGPRWRARSGLGRRIRHGSSGRRGPSPSAHRSDRWRRLSPNVSTLVKFSSRRPAASSRGLSTRKGNGSRHARRRRAPESDSLVPQGHEEGLVAVGLAVGLAECSRIPKRGSGGVAEIKAGVGLPDDHDPSRIVCGRLPEGLVQPGDVGRVPGGLIGRIRSGVAQVVAGPLDVHRCVGHVRDRPAAVLDTGCRLGDRGSGGRSTDVAEAGRCRLDLLCHRVAPGRHRRAEEHLAFVVESLEAS